MFRSRQVPRAWSRKARTRACSSLETAEEPRAAAAGTEANAARRASLSIRRALALMGGSILPPDRLACHGLPHVVIPSAVPGRRARDPRAESPARGRPPPNDVTSPDRAPEAWVSILDVLRRGFSRTFWVANVLELFERFAYYGRSEE